jgi:CheY-like chemotaxis protein
VGKVDGTEAARHILVQEELRGVQIVALTGWDQSLYREGAREAGVVAHLVKPVVSERLDEVLDGLERVATQRRRSRLAATHSVLLSRLSKRMAYSR